jgi:hypothetical protein
MILRQMMRQDEGISITGEAACIITSQCNLDTIGTLLKETKRKGIILDPSMMVKAAAKNTLNIFEDVLSYFRDLSMPYLEAAVENGRIRDSPIAVPIRIILPVTQDLLIAAACNPGGKKVLEFLFLRDRNLKVTQDLLEGIVETTPVSSHWQSTVLDNIKFLFNQNRDLKVSTNTVQWVAIHAQGFKLLKLFSRAGEIFH